MADYKTLSNKKLVRLCINKDVLAWFEFVRRFKRLAYYAIEERLKRWNYIYQSSDIEDIGQEVFISIWENGLLENLRDAEKIVPWLAIIAANRAVSFFRKKSIPPPNTVSVFTEEGLPDLVDTHNPGPLDEIIFKDSFKNILAIIKTLSPKEKNVLRLSLLYGKSHSAIAKTLKLPCGSINSAAKRAKAKIKEGLKNLK